jgi:hypothetical protein
MFLLLIGMTQWVSFWAYRRRVAFQVFFGLTLCLALAVILTYSRFSFFWEIQYPDKSNPITWRSGLLFLVLLAVTQWLASLIFRKLAKKPGIPSALP